LKKAGCKHVFFLNKATRVHVKRTELPQYLEALAAGDTFIIWKLNRLGRSLSDLIDLLDDMKARDVAFPVADGSD
jgi:DNA invertase Pin-like site-specific DNA recombinase